MKYMHKLACHFAAALTLITIAGCAATGPRFSGPQLAEPGKGTVYVYRPSKFLGAGKPYELFLDDQKIGSLPNASFIKLSLRPGAHTIVLIPAFAESSGQRVGEQFEIVPNTSRFFRLDLQTSNVGTLVNGGLPSTSLWKSNNRLANINESRALVELAELNAAQ